MRHIKSSLIYAVKHMSKNMLKNNAMTEQIVNEIKIMYSLHHENIIKLYNHFEDDDMIYLVIEYASGVFKSIKIIYLLIIRDSYGKKCIEVKERKYPKDKLPLYFNLFKLKY